MNYSPGLSNPKAQSEGLSLNKTFKKLLEESLGVTPRNKGINRRDFEKFCGTWSESDLTEFEDKTEDLRNVNYEKSSAC